MIDNIRRLLAPAVDTDTKLSVISLFIGKILGTVDARLADLEARQLQKGDKGDTGERGAKGEAGLPGRDGAPGIQGLPGLVGPAGKDGKAGKAGKEGVSVVDAEISADDHLVLKLSNGNIIDAGELPVAEASSRMMVSGNAWQIAVSATAPANPQVNDLWLDIA